MKKTVVIIGGGVAGMSAAHELLQRSGSGVDFDIHVYERGQTMGGKARSILVPPPAPRKAVSSEKRQSMAVPRAVGGSAQLPGEHGFRFFPSFYRHLPDTMEHIPTPSGSVLSHLVEAPRLELARVRKPSVVVGTRFPRTLGDFLLLAQDAFSDLGISRMEVACFSSKIWQLMTSCTERRLAEYEKLTWWDYVEAEKHSIAYRELLAEGLSRSLLANDPKQASARTVGNTNVQLLLGLLKPGQAIDRVLDGPTSEAWLSPWLRHLEDESERRKVTFEYHFEARVTGVRADNGRISGIVVSKGESAPETTESGDYYIFATPVERMAQLIEMSCLHGTADLVRLDPSLEGILKLKSKVAWMNGIQFFLYRPLRVAVRGHYLFVNSPWSLTAIAEGQFWKVNLASRGDGTVRDVLSVCISNWESPGLLYKKPARELMHEQIASEVWAQLKMSLNVDGADVLRDEDLHSWFLDPDIISTNPQQRMMPAKYDDMEPLLVNHKDTWQLRPKAKTAIANLFLAADYIQTNTDVACMEAANEAARAAVNCILDESGSAASYCGLWELHEPEMLMPLRAIDKLKFLGGLPWSLTTGIGPALSVANTLLEVSGAALPAPTAPSALPRYVERPGEQCHLPPYACDHARMFGFVVAGNVRAIQQNVIDPCLNVCTNGAFDFRALSDLVLVTFTDAAQGRSLSSPDSEKGFTREQSCVVWTPVVSTHGGVKLYLFVSYIVVDDAWSLVAGREVHGFPKSFGKIDMPEHDQPSKPFSATTTVLEKFGFNEPATQKEILGVRANNVDAQEASSWSTVEEALHELMTLATNATHQQIRVPGLDVLVNLLEHVKPHALPVIFLKQYRDAADGTRACYQGLIEASSSVTAFRAGRLLAGQFDLTAATFASHPVASDLGFEGGRVRAKLSFFVDIDFTFNAGREVWRGS